MLFKDEMILSVRIILCSFQGKFALTIYRITMIFQDTVVTT